MTLAIKNVNFLGFEIMVIELNGVTYIPMRTLVNDLGLDWPSQFKKIKQRFKSTVMKITTVASDGKKRSMLCLPLNKLFSWIWSIEPGKVAPHKKQTIIDMQNKSDEFLFHYWTIGKPLREQIP